MKLISNKRVLDLFNTQVMGILNLTPDSFYDGGLYNTLSKSIDHVSKMINYGATLIDIGGESTRPGSNRISDEEEANRVLPILREIMNRFDVFISINTSSALVMSESIKLGVHLINDIRSFDSEESLRVAVCSELLVCVMHMKNSMHYSDILHEVDNYFKEQIVRFELAGMNRTQLLLDPGFGFGKTVSDNYRLLSNLNYFHHFNLPLLVGVSRKSMFNLNGINNAMSSLPKHRLIASVSAVVIAAMKGVQIVRVHDVKETMEALNVVRVVQKNHQDREMAK
ncbi:dihydropteroate synthase [Candidatus Blochmanniella floridana]|uniref:Dihydropteroate synthase n=1 Tax=Blochmanniella floridana TaxID=203907 RepID=Q7VQM6_BLOFL|nr:dihydropteroate synthase [Candidatus Blochmannia floridanus]